MLGFVVTFVIAFLAWVYLNASLNTEILIVGVLAAAVTAALSSKILFNDFKPSHLHPKRLFYSIIYLFSFGIALLIANLKMCFTILRPNPGLKPAVLRIPLEGASDAVKTGVANSITLTPGTLTLEVDNDALYVHWIKASTTDPVKAKKEVVGRFEKHLRGVFE